MQTYSISHLSHMTPMAAFFFFLMAAWKRGRTVEWQRTSSQSGGEETDIDK